MKKHLQIHYHPKAAFNFKPQLFVYFKLFVYKTLVIRHMGKLIVHVFMWSLTTLQIKDIENELRNLFFK